MKTVLCRPTSDGNVREYHILDAQISEVPYLDFFRPTWGTEDEFSLLGPAGEKIAQGLMNPDHGEKIERIAFHTDSVRVRKTATANWGSLEPSIIKPAIEAGLEDNIEMRQYRRAKLRQLTYA